MRWLFLILAFCCGCGTQDTKGIQQKKSVKIAIEEDPSTIDPRLARTLYDVTFMRLLYEGLMRVNNQGELENALAEKIIVSSDRKNYEVRLKEAYWSDGSLVTAEDFVETWKTMLNPNFPSPNASKLFMIKGAKEAKKGTVPLDAVELKALSPQVFTFALEQPIAYFNELMILFPVHQSVRNGIASANPKDHVFNGPFKLDDWSHHHRLSFTKNPGYWDANAVQLEGIQLEITDGTTMLSLFNQGQLDWAGSPLATIPQDALQDLKRRDALEMANASATYWFRFNTAKGPFANINMRKAFNLALNRNDIVEHVTQGNQLPAHGILPPSMALQQPPKAYFQDNHAEAALDHLQLAKQELEALGGHFPEVVLCYANNERNHKIAQAVQQQWQNALGVPVSLQAYESKVAFEKLSKGNYQIMLGSWFADINDPVDFLNVFKTKSNGTNNTGWEDARYAELLEKSDQEEDPIERMRLLAQAEEILMDAMPIAPLFHNTYNYMKSKSVEGVYFSELGHLDFKNARIAP